MYTNAECVDSMNYAMIVGMTTSVNQDNAIALFNHQMIPHHQNAVNMCKALFKSGETDCDDLADVEDPKLNFRALSRNHQRPNFSDSKYEGCRR